MPSPTHICIGLTDLNFNNYIHTKPLHPKPVEKKIKKIESLDYMDLHQLYYCFEETTDPRQIKNTTAISALPKNTAHVTAGDLATLYFTKKRD